MNLVKLTNIQTASPPVGAVVAVVGGGAAGALAVAGIAASSRREDRSTAVTVIDPRGSVGRGAAFSTPTQCHLLNVPAGRMGALPSDPGGFLSWLHQHGHHEVGSGDFVPRAWFGDYLADTVRDAVDASTRVSSEHVRDRAVALRRHRGRIEIRLRSGAVQVVDAAVLAVGNLEPRTDWAPATLRASQRFIADPWGPGSLQRIEPADSVLLVGSGLTMVDVALALAKPGRVLTAISRGGRLPRSHRDQPSSPVPPPAQLQRCPSLESTLATLRAHLRQCTDEHGDWRAGVDGLRPVTAQLWQRLTEQERVRAIQEHSSWWNRHRHRMAPAVARELDRLLAEDHLRVQAGEVEAVTETETGLRVQLTDGAVLHVDAVVNCTGQQTDLRQTSDPLISSMLASGIARPGPAGLGLDTDADGGIRDRDGEPVPGLYTLGATRIGQLWESTAIPEIRQQAAAVGACITDSLRRKTVRRRPQDCLGLPLSTSSAAAEAYSAALLRIMRVQTGALDDLRAAVEIDPRFALGHTVLALLGHEWNLGIDVDASLERGVAALEHSGDEREVSFVRAAAERIRDSGTDALLRHVTAHPRDALAVSLLLPTIAFTGSTLALDTAWRLVDDLAPAYTDEWWFNGVQAFGWQEQDRHDAAAHLAQRALDVEPAAGHAVHARTHIFHETGQHRAGLIWLDRWIRGHSADALCPAHFSWHAGLHELALGDLTAGRARYADQLCPARVHGVRALIDSASFLWRARLAGAPDSRDEARVILGSLKPGLTAAPPNGFIAFHLAFALATAEDIDGLARLERYADSSPDTDVRELVAPLAVALRAVLANQRAEAYSALTGIEAKLARLGGSAIQRGIVAQTLRHLAPDPRSPVRPLLR